MTLDNAQSLAESFLAGGESLPLRADTTVKLARALLAVLPVVRMSERVVSRGIHRRDDHRHVVDRRVELLPNDIEILGKLAEAVEKMRGAE